MPYDDDATGASVKPSSIPTIEDIPAEYPLPHDASVWTQKMEDSLGPLLAVAKGKWPASALLIMDEPLENYPELPEDHPHYLRRTAARTIAFAFATSRRSTRRRGSPYFSKHARRSTRRSRRRATRTRRASPTSSLSNAT